MAGRGSDDGRGAPDGGRRGARRRILSEADYAAAWPDRVLRRRPAVRAGTGPGRVAFYPSEQDVDVAPKPFDEFGLRIEDATLLHPNVVLFEGGNILDSNIGFTTMELVDHYLPGYPLRRIHGAISVTVPEAAAVFETCAYLTLFDNYSAFLLGELPRVEAYREHLDGGVPLVVHGDLLPFHRDLLDLAGVAPDRIVQAPATAAVRAGSLIHTTPTFLHHQPSHAALEFLRTGLATPPGQVWDRVYLSRSKLGLDANRAILNEQALEERLRRLGFEILHPQDLSVAEQISVFRTASILIAPLGATWANAAFRRSGSRSLMLVTKWTPEFGRIFRHVGADLDVLPLDGGKVRDGATLSASHAFWVMEEQLAAIERFAAGG